MDIETLDRANRLNDLIIGLQAEIKTWEGSKSFEKEVRLSDGHHLRLVDISYDDFEFIRDYMLGKLRERLAEAEKQFESL